MKVTEIGQIVLAHEHFLILLTKLQHWSPTLDYTISSL